jgi:hypothetical protein
VDEKPLAFVNQLIKKTEQGKLSWSTGFEDGQFKTLLPGGKLAFVVQERDGVRKFQMLDDRQEVILDKAIQGRYVSGVPGGTPGSPTFQTYEGNDKTPPPDLLRTQYLRGQVDVLFEAIGNLQMLARSRALQVDEKLAKAEKLLAAI